MYVEYMHILYGFGRFWQESFDMAVLKIVAKKHKLFTRSSVASSL